MLQNKIRGNPMSIKCKNIKAQIILNSSNNISIYNYLWNEPVTEFFHISYSFYFTLKDQVLFDLNEKWG